MTFHPFVVQHAVKRIRFIRRGEVANLGNVPPGRAVLELLRADFGSAPAPKRAAAKATAALSPLYTPRSRMAHFVLPGRTARQGAG